jgi:hypothetical protein
MERAIGGGQGLKKLNGKRTKVHSLQRWPLRQVLRCRWLVRAKVLRPHLLRCPQPQGLRLHHRP